MTTVPFLFEKYEEYLMFYKSKRKRKKTGSRNVPAEVIEAYCTSQINSGLIQVLNLSSTRGSLINFSPCFTFFNTYDFYNKRVYDLTDESHDASDREAACTKAQEWSYGEGDRIPCGIFYQVERPTTDEKLSAGIIPVNLKPGNIKAILEKHI